MLLQNVGKQRAGRLPHDHAGVSRQPAQAPPEAHHHSAWPEEDLSATQPTRGPG